MSPNHTRSLREIFLEAVEIEDAAARAAYLNAACGNDISLRQRVERLLAADSEAGLPIDAPSSSVIRREDLVGTQIEGYKLLQEIGEGGCGAVYMAEQEKPVRRKVALKIIKLGMDTKQVVARFEAERQALAMMDHPNIARVFDAGATDTGRPFFVMELVRGIKITDYCDEHQLSTRQRLDLFMQVCHAVQHAHQKGIIHRDLKPSNVLVTEVDGKPVPKVIDFGIAKAVEGRLTDNTLFTAFEQLVGTPSYMSPEQASLASADIDTRSDIYSLGVMLYQLLTGETPFDTKALLAAGLDEMRRTISERVPARPSTRLTTMAPDQVESVARARGSEPSRFAHQLAGDLDWIVMKCLEKERGRRYETANGLAMDVQRHLNNEPIIARPPSRLYEFQKTVRRHKIGFAATAAVILALAAGIVASSWQAFRASSAEQQAVQERDRAVNSEQQAEQERNQAERLAAEAALEKGQSKLEAGDSLGLLDLVEAFRFAQHDPALRETIGRRWSIWHAEWEQRTIAVRPSSGIRSPDYLRFATLSDWPPLNNSPVVEVRDLLTGAWIAGPWTHDSVAKGGAFSPDGRLLAVVTEKGVIHLWDCRTGAPARAPCDTGVLELDSLKFSKDGRFLVAFALSVAGQRSTNAVLLRLDEPRGTPHLLGHGLPVGDVRFSPDGELLAAYCRSEVQVWRTADLQPMGAPIATSFSGLVEFNDDGSWLAISPPASPSLRLLEPETQRILFEIPVTGSGEAAATGFSHDGTLLATCNWDGSLQLWRTNSVHQPYATHRFRERMRGGFSFNTDDSRLAVADAGGIVRVMSTKDGRITHLLRLKDPFGARFLTNGVLAATAFTQAAFWDLTATPLRAEVLPDDALATSMAFDRSGERLAVGGEGELRLWRMAEALRLERILSMPGRVLSLIFSDAENRFVVFTDDGSLTGVDPRTGSSSLIRRIERGCYMQAYLSPEARKLALVRFNEALVVDLPTGDFQWLPNEGGFLSVAFPRGLKRMAVGVASWRVCFYDLSNQEPALLGEVNEMGGWVRDVAFHPDGGLLAANVEKKLICLVDPNSKRQLFSGYAPALAELELLQFSPDGALLATAGTTQEGGYGVEIWHVDRQRGLSRAGSILPSEHPIESLAFSPDSRKLVAGGAGATRVWHLPPTPGSLEEVQSQTQDTLGFRMDEQGNPVFADLTAKEVGEVRARLTQAPVSTVASLEPALKLPPTEALAALESLARQRPDSSAYIKLQSRLHRELMESHAQQGLWKNAIAHANEAVRLGDHEPWTLAQQAFLFSLAGDVESYRASCAAMVERYQSRHDPRVVSAVVGAVAVSPGALEDYSGLVEQVRRSLPLAGGVDGPAQQFELGLVLARAGHYAEAAKALEELDRFVATGVRVGFPPAHKFMVSICHAHLGDLDEARRWFDVAAREAKPVLQPNQPTSSLNEFWWGRAALEVFMKEAEMLLRTSPSKPGRSE